MALVADTHTAIWYTTGDARLSFIAREALDAAIRKRKPIYLASISLVEITYLTEKKRLEPHVLPALLALLKDSQNSLSLYPLDEKVCRAVGLVQRSQVPDMPDRIITATALALGFPLVTADRKIQKFSIETIW